MASAFAAAALLAGPSTSGTDAAAARACAFDPDFGAVLRPVLAGVFRAGLAGVLRVDADAARFAGAFRFAVAGLDLEEEAGVFFAAGFLRPALERVELDFELLLGFFGDAMATHCSGTPRIRRRLGN